MAPKPPRETGPASGAPGGSLLPPYAELHCLSNFSFLRGASFPEELVERADSLGYRAIALTDECSLSGVVRAHMAARERDIALVVGSEFHLSEPDGGELLLILLACNRHGWSSANWRS